MRKKIGMRWRRACLRRGGKVEREGPAFTKKELREDGLTRNAYLIELKYKRNTYRIVDEDMLSAYKLAYWCMDIEDEEEADPDGIHTIGGIWLSDTGKADWIRE